MRWVWTTAATISLLSSSVLNAAETTVTRNVSYVPTKASDSALHALDVYAPKSGANHPILIYIHGGGWRRGDKAHVGMKPDAFADKGFVLASINYRLAPSVDYKQQASDVAQAIRYVREHAADWGGSPKDLYLMGHSAGAHLAALVAVDERYLKEQKLSLNALRGVILLDGAGYDIPKHLRTAGPMAKRLYEGVFGEDPKVQADASPIHHVAVGKSIPPFLIVPVADRRDSRMQSQALAGALRKAGGSAVVTPAVGKTHGSLNQELGQAGDAPTQAVFDFLSQRQQSASLSSKSSR